MFECSSGLERNPSSTQTGQGLQQMDDVAYMTPSCQIIEFNGPRDRSLEPVSESRC